MVHSESAQILPCDLETAVEVAAAAGLTVAYPGTTVRGSGAVPAAVAPALGRMGCSDNHNLTAAAAAQPVVDIGLAVDTGSAVDIEPAVLAGPAGSEKRMDYRSSLEPSAAQHHHSAVESVAEGWAQHPEHQMGSQTKHLPMCWVGYQN
jgi:hypothetical protein